VTGGRGADPVGGDQGGGGPGGSDGSGTDGAGSDGVGPEGVDPNGFGTDGAGPDDFHPDDFVIHPDRGSTDASGAGPDAVFWPDTPVDSPPRSGRRSLLAVMAIAGILLLVLAIGLFGGIV